MERNKELEKYKIIWNNIPCIIFILDEKRNILEANEKIKELDYEIEDLIGKNLYDIPSFISKDSLNKLFEKKGEIIKLDVFSGKKEKKIVNAQLIELEEETARYLIIIHDITEEEQIKTKLYEDEELLKEWFNLAEKSVAGIYIYDEDFNFLYVNPSFCNITGYTEEEIIGKKKSYELVHPDDVNLSKEMAEKRFKGEIEIASFNIRFKRPDGKIRQCFAIGRVGRYKGKKVITGTLIDITDRVNLENKLKEEHALLEKTLDGTIHAISKIVEIKDPYTAGHQINVAKLSEEISKEIGFNKEKIKEIIYASLLHDIGKISVPTEILVLPRKLTPIEFSIIKTHPIVAYNILKVIPNFENLAEIVLQHHERLDGTGYPRGIKGEKILKEARIIAVSDVVEAMINHRPYRPALSLEEALEEIDNNKGIKYDEEIVDVVIYLFKKKNFSFI
ncbi:MAG TPA: PAS domain S-box protein [bacterium]|nr:PAS domain S-box protein [bacterium]HOM26214.1 PAS domain S-box protein [bacterium]